MPHAKYERLIAAAKEVPAASTIVVHPCDETSLRGCVEAAQGRHHYSDFGRAGRQDQNGRAAIISWTSSNSRSSTRRTSKSASAAKAVELIHQGKGEMLMKGSLHTDELMRAVTSSTKDCAPRAGSVTSSSWMCRPIPTPSSLPTRRSISRPISIPSGTSSKTRSIFSRRSALARPVSAILSAVETVTSKIPSTIEAAALCKMAERGQITGGVLDGPLAFDNAIDQEAAKIKGIKSEVAGRAQILLVPDLEAGNMLAKNLAFLSKADAAGIVLGARVPIVLTSRADSVRTRMASCAVAVLYANARRQSAVLPAA